VELRRVLSGSTMGVLGAGGSLAGTTVAQGAGEAPELHRAWLELVETDGPFLAIPPLKRVWPQGIPNAPRSRSRGVAAARVNRSSVCGIGGGGCRFPGEGRTPPGPRLRGQSGVWFLLGLVCIPG